MKNNIKTEGSIFFLLFKISLQNAFVTVNGVNNNIFFEVTYRRTHKRKDGTQSGKSAFASRGEGREA